MKDNHQLIRSNAGLCLCSSVDSSFLNVYVAGSCVFTSGIDHIIQILGFRISVKILMCY